MSFEPGMPVIYVPYHAFGNCHHPDCERGIITSLNPSTETIFVRFGNMPNSQGCRPDQLVPEACAEPKKECRRA